MKYMLTLILLIMSLAVNVSLLTASDFRKSLSERELNIYRVASDISALHTRALAVECKTESDIEACIEGHYGTENEYQLVLKHHNIPNIYAQDFDEPFDVNTLFEYGCKTGSIVKGFK